MTAKLTIDGAEEPYKSLTISESVSQIGTWSAALPTVRDLTAFAPVTVTKDGVAIFGGRLQEPTNRFSRGGSVNNVRGFDYSVRLTDYLTPYSSIVDSSTAVAIDTILTNTPFTASIESTFGYDSPLVFLDTWLEMVTDIEVFSDVTVELDLDAAEIEDTVNVGTWTGCNIGLKSCFFYDGATKRFYVFAKNDADDLYYYHSTDGETWTGVDTGYNPSGDAWSVAWHSDKVYLFIYDGANTDFYRGTINDGTGAITFGVATGNIFGGTIRFGPVWDSQGDMWVIRDNNNGEAYESTDDGATWNNRFGPGGTELWGLADMDNDGDMMGVVLDVPNTDLEEWLWDRSAGTFTFVAKMDDENDVDGLDVCQDADYNVYVALWDGDVILTHCNKSGSWNTDTIDFTPGLFSFSVGSDGKYAYVIVGWSGGVTVTKYYDNVIQETYSTGTYGTPHYVNVPRGYLQDGQIATFFQIRDSNEDIWFLAFTHEGLRLVEGAATGYIRTETITASGPMQYWGAMVARGTQLTDTDWSILKAADNSVLVDEQPYAFNMNSAGVPATETSIKVLADFTDAGTDPYVANILVTEALDIVTLELDYDTVYEALTKWSKLSGGEFWLDEDDVLHLADTRGTDKSGTVTLKNARTPRHPGTPPNIKVVDVKTDWTSYANCIRVLGAGTPPLRAEADLINQTQVNIYGEHWATLRNQDLETVEMALSAAEQELERRATILRRIKVEFLDEYDAGTIGVGDTVTLAAMYGDDADTEIDAPVRIVKLVRTFNSTGEHVSAECVNHVKASEFYNYLGNVSDLLRWIVA